MFEYLKSEDWATLESEFPEFFSRARGINLENEYNALRGELERGIEHGTRRSYVSDRVAELGLWREQEAIYRDIQETEDCEKLEMIAERQKDLNTRRQHWMMNREKAKKQKRL